MTRNLPLNTFNDLPRGRHRLSSHTTHQRPCSIALCLPCKDRDKPRPVERCNANNGCNRRTLSKSRSVFHVEEPPSSYTTRHPHNSPVVPMKINRSQDQANSVESPTWKIQSWQRRFLTVRTSPASRRVGGCAARFRGILTTDGAMVHCVFHVEDAALLAGERSGIN